LGALDLSQAFSVWKRGFNLPGNQVQGIGLIQNLDKPFMIDLKFPSKVEAVIGDITYGIEVFIPKPPPPKLGEEVVVTIVKTRFRLKPDQVNVWMLKFGTLVKAANFVATEIDGIHADTIECSMKLRKHVPGTLPAYGRKMLVRYAGRPEQCNQCYQFNHLRKECKNTAVEWSTYVKAFVDESEGSRIVPDEMIGNWKRLL